MGTTAEKLAYLNQTKQQLKTAINNKGGTLTDSDTFRDYVGAVNDIVTEQHTDYAGPYTVTQNGTLQTAGKAMTSNLTVNVASSGILETSWATYKQNNPKSWYNAFYNFNSARALSSVNIGALDFSGSENVTSMNSMFSLSGISSVPLFDTSSCTDMTSMFESCISLGSVPSFNTANVTKMTSMFNNCGGLMYGPSFNTASVTNMDGMFRSCTNLMSIPLYNTSSVTSMAVMFYGCRNLSSIPAFDVSNVTNLSSMFEGCSSLSTIHMTGMKVNFKISSSTRFTQKALVEIINNLADLTGGTAQTLTMGSTNLAKLTADDIAIATAKNWTLA